MAFFTFSEALLKKKLKGFFMCCYTSFAKLLVHICQREHSSSSKKKKEEEEEEEEE